MSSTDNENHSQLDHKPTSISILGKSFEIRYTRKIDKDNSYGECDGPSRVIKIRSDLEGEQLEDTLLHEFLHGILYISGQSESLDQHQEEALVLALENGLSQIYQRIVK